MLAFIHLSDIHFNKNSGDKYDLDEDLRNELLSDIREHFLAAIPKADGILVCGDIAFSGKAVEYKIASDFLGQICSILSLPEERIYCVPGNHDVDQDVPKNSPATKLLQEKLEAQTVLNNFDKFLGDICHDSQSASALFAPIETYNSQFAEKYGCDIRYNRPNMAHSMPLADGYILCIVGMNSVLISNSGDHQGENERKMQIGHLQIPHRCPGDIYLTLCHHPPECWIDPDGLLSAKLNERVHIQLYGHKHLQYYKQVENTLIISSGAAHPSRWDSDWIPRYNWITIEVSEQGQLAVNIYPRKLNALGTHFEKDDSLGADDKLSFTLALPNACCNIDKEMPLPTELLSEEIVSSPMPLWEKRFVYSFMSLPYVRRNRIIERFGLSSQEDEGLKHVEMLENIMQRALEKGCKEELLLEVEKENEGMA